MRWYEYVIILFVAFAIGYATHKYTIKPIVTTEIEYIKGDTDTLWQPAVVLRDTIRLPAEVDTTAEGVIVSHADTTLTQDSSYVHLSLFHYSEPNYFKIEADWSLRPQLIFRVDTVKVKTKEVFPCEERWWEKIDLGVGVGATWYDNQFRVMPAIGIYYRIF